MGQMMLNHYLFDADSQHASAASWPFGQDSAAACHMTALPWQAAACFVTQNLESPFTGGGVAQTGPDSAKPLEAVRCSHATSNPCTMALWAHFGC